MLALPGPKHTTSNAKSGCLGSTAGAELHACIHRYVLYFFILHACMHAHMHACIVLGSCMLQAASASAARPNAVDAESDRKEKSKELRRL